MDDVATDVVAGRPPPASWAAAAMQSSWMARAYGAWWRPAIFALSTGFGAPSASRESRLVLERLGSRDGPWMDLSCGPGALTRRLLLAARREGRGREVVAVDLSRPMLEQCRHVAGSALRVRADAADLPFVDGVFAAVCNLAALDLYADPARVMTEVARVLAPGGRWIASSFLAARKSAARLLAASRRPTLAQMESWAIRAGLVRFDAMQFRHYAVAWADRDGPSSQDGTP